MPKKRKAPRAKRPQGRPQARAKPGRDVSARTSAPRQGLTPTGAPRLLETTSSRKIAESSAAPVRREPQPEAADATGLEQRRLSGADTLYGVAPTYWFEGSGRERPAAVHFLGDAVDAENRGQRFERTVRVPDLPAGAGRASVSATVRDLPAGAWRVQAQGLDEQSRPVGAPQVQELATSLSPFVRGPGVRPFAWPVLVLLGVVLAVVTQVLLVRSEGLDARTAGWSAVGAAVVGFLAAKLGFMVWHRIPPRDFATAGTMIQVFLVAAFGSLTGFAWLAGLPVLLLLDLTAPGVFAAMALARPGCWLGGCCAGRPTAGRWGLWSSDRRVAVRRVPVQLLESALAGAVALGSLVLVLTVEQRPYGVVLALAASVYTLGRQLLFPLRAEARRSSRSRLLVTAAASAAALLSLALLLVPSAA